MVPAEATADSFIEVPLDDATKYEFYIVFATKGGSYAITEKITIEILQATVIDPKISDYYN